MPWCDLSRGLAPTILMVTVWAIIQLAWYRHDCGSKGPCAVMVIVLIALKVCKGQLCVASAPCILDRHCIGEGQKTKQMTTILVCRTVELPGVLTIVQGKGRYLF